MAVFKAGLTDFDKWKKTGNAELEKMRLVIRDLKSRTTQLPVAFFLTIVWIALFGGLVVAVIMAYLGNVFFDLYGMREDERPTYWRKVAREMHQKDRNQPLLGFTLLIVLVLIVVAIVFFRGTGMPFSG